MTRHEYFKEANKKYYIKPNVSISWDLELFNHGYDFSKDEDDWDNLRIVRFVNILYNNYR